MQRSTATIEECKEALRKLSDADLRRLDELARICAKRSISISGQDLRQEAIVRMLEGKRKWPLDVPLLAFLQGTMRSIASNQSEKQKRTLVVVESDVARNREEGDGVIAMAADPSRPPEAEAEAEAEAAQILGQIKELFKDDKVALAVIVGKEAEKSPGEIQEENAIDPVRYATTLRRIRRRLNHFDKRRKQHGQHTERARAS